MKLASISAKTIYNSNESGYYWRTFFVEEQSVYFNIRLDAGECNFNRVHKFVSKSELLQSRKDKIKILKKNQGFYSFYLSNQLCPKEQKKYSISYIESDRFWLIIVPKFFCSWFLRMVVNGSVVCNIVFITFLIMVTVGHGYWLPMRSSTQQES